MGAPGRSRPPPGKPPKAKGSLMLPLSMLLLLVSSVMNSIYFKKMTSAMPNYSWFLSELTTVVYTPLFFTVVYGPYLVPRPGRKTLKEANLSGSLPRTVFAVMGMFDGMSSVLMVLGSVWTAGTTQLILRQATIPMTLVISILALGIRYHWMQYVGAGTIIAGVLVTKLPDFLGHGSGGAQDRVLFNMVFLASSVPNALSSVYKEVAFRKAGNVDVNYLQFWVATFQVVATLLAMPIYNMPFLGPQRVPFDAMPSQLTGGTSCLFFGTNTIVTNCGGPGQSECDHCEGALGPTIVYMIANVAFNVANVLVIKYGSAALSFLVLTLQMPLTSIAFCSKAVMGSAAQSPQMSTFAGLGILILGLVAYRQGGNMMEKEKTSTLAVSQMVTVGTVGAMQFVLPSSRPKLVPRSPDMLRSQMYARLGVASPLASPLLRASASQLSSPGPGSPLSLARSEPEDTVSVQDL
mmetsp:Transcript_115247/g.264629  ORF Transcript_115247/g.264629 Transcript_115247/m.264629 type:complete len:464 (+) Transcript_115247:42-1433(+)